MDYLEMAEGMIDEYMTSLAIQWPDEARRSRVKIFCADGMAYIDSFMPAPVDWNVNRNARRLLLIYVMYAEAHAVDEFEGNYTSQIVGLKMDAERDAYMEGGDYAQELP